MRSNNWSIGSSSEWPSGSPNFDDTPYVDPVVFLQSHTPIVHPAPLQFVFAWEPHEILTDKESQQVTHLCQLVAAFFLLIVLTSLGRFFALTHKYA